MTKLFAAIIKDAADTDAARTELRQPHLDHIAASVPHLSLAGPLVDDAGTAIGSLLVVKADSAEDARELVQRDPFYAAGVWAQIDIIEFKAAAGEWVGGITW
jgi:uncharacterized protein YciI